MQAPLFSVSISIYLKLFFIANKYLNILTVVAWQALQALSGNIITVTLSKDKSDYN